MIWSRYAASYKIATAVLCLLAHPSLAAEPAPLSPLVLNARYSIAWSGIPIGRINITAREETGGQYSMAIDTKTKGIAAMISDEAQVVSVEGTKAADGTYIPAKYLSRPMKKDDEDVITLTYDAKGNIANRQRTRDDDPAWRPPVPFAKVNTAHDPITAAFILRRDLYSTLTSGKKEVSTRTYDGMRLANMRLIRASNVKVEIMGQYIDAVNVGITREPLDGYTPKELKKYKKGDPEIHLYFSNDAAFLPIRASAKATLGELSMTLVSVDGK